MTQEERDQVAAVINFFWGEGIAKPSQITEGVAQIAYDALSEAGECTGNMELVPRPLKSSRASVMS